MHSEHSGAVQPNILDILNVYIQIKLHIYICIQINTDILNVYIQINICVYH